MVHVLLTVEQALEHPKLLAIEKSSLGNLGKSGTREPSCLISIISVPK
jgi:hypothetical protein